MNEHPETTDEHGDDGVDPQNEVCPTCAGSGIIRAQFGFSYITTFNCVECGGTGKLSEALARKLSGES